MSLMGIFRLSCFNCSFLWPFAKLLILLSNYAEQKRCRNRYTAYLPDCRAVKVQNIINCLLLLTLLLVASTNVMLWNGYKITNYLITHHGFGPFIFNVAIFTAVFVCFVHVYRCEYECECDCTLEYIILR